jgi:mono/diheme cytochrome c family protein
MRITKHAGLFIGLFALLLLLAAGLLSRPASAQEPVDQEKLNRGAQLYVDNCAVCHGENGEGRVGASLTQAWPSIRPDLTVQNTIANGIPGSAMPAWSQASGGPLTDAEIDDLTYYILSWQEGGPPAVDLGPTATPRPPITPVPDVSGDPNTGGVLYDQNCAVCHGANGEGRIGATLAQDWPSIRPDLAVRTTIANGISGSTMPAWSQANGGPLSEQEIDHITAFVIALEPGVVATTPESTPEPAPVANDLRWLLWLGGFVLLVVIIMLVSRRAR